MIEGTPSIGAELKARREGRGLTIGHASKQTHIKARYIQAIEAMQPDALPSLGYVLGFVRTYAGYLDMDGEIAVKRYKEDVAAPKLLGWRERAILIPRREIKLPRGLISAMSAEICQSTKYYGCERSSKCRSRYDRNSAGFAQCFNCKGHWAVMGSG